MSWGYVAVGAATLISGYMGSEAQSDAADEASGAQRDASAAGIAEERRQFDQVRELLKPYIDAGTGAIGQQQALLGLGGADAQRQAISALEGSPQMAALTQQGENALLQNASATGGLRGGNLQAGLAQFRPQLLSQLIESQFGKLGSVAGLGQASAAGQAAMGQQSGSNISALLSQQGQAIAGNALAQGQAQSQMWGTVGNVAGQVGGYYMGGGRF